MKSETLKKLENQLDIVVRITNKLDTLGIEYILVGNTLLHLIQFIRNKFGYFRGTEDIDIDVVRQPNIDIENEIEKIVSMVREGDFTKKISDNEVITIKYNDKDEISGLNRFDFQLVDVSQYRIKTYTYKGNKIKGASIEDMIVNKINALSNVRYGRNKDCFDIFILYQMFPIDEKYIVKKLNTFYDDLGEFKYFLNKNRYILDLSETWNVEEDFNADKVYKFVYEEIMSLLDKVIEYKEININNNSTFDKTEIKECKW